MSLHPLFIIVWTAFPFDLVGASNWPPIFAARSEVSVPRQSHTLSNISWFYHCRIQSWKCVPNVGAQEILSRLNTWPECGADAGIQCSMVQLTWGYIILKVLGHHSSPAKSLPSAHLRIRLIWVSVRRSPLGSGSGREVPVVCRGIRSALAPDPLSDSKMYSRRNCPPGVHSDRKSDPHPSQASVSLRTGSPNASSWPARVSAIYVAYKTASR